MTITSRHSPRLLWSTLSLLVLLLVQSSSAFQPADRITGLWIPEEEDSNVRIVNNNSKYEGSIVWLQEPFQADGKTPVVDHLNSDPELAKRKLDGLKIVSGLEYDASKDRWEGGRIYDPDDGKTYDCFCWFDKDDTSKLKLKGYVLGIKFLGRETTFTRKEEEKEEL